MNQWNMHIAVYAERLKEISKEIQANWELLFVIPVLDGLMASQHRKHRGYRTTRLIANYFVEEGFTDAYPVGAGEQGSDIKRLPFDVEVKARSGFNPKAALAQIKARTNRLGFAILRLNGQGEDVRDYCAVIRFEDLMSLLKRAGWDKVKDTEPIRCSKCGAWNIEGMECLTCRNMIINV